MKIANKKKTIIKWTVYWALILSVYVALSIIWQSFSVFYPIPLLAAFNFAVRLIIGLPMIRMKNERVLFWMRLTANLLSVAATVYIFNTIIQNGVQYNESYINSLDYSVFDHNSTVTYNHENGVYTIRAESDELRILQLTDIHICSSITTIGLDRKALKACYETIKSARPDLIIVTGDVVYTSPTKTFSKNNLNPIYQFCTFMNNIGIPWAMVYGNHDTEAIATYDERSFEGIFRHFMADNNCPMLYAEHQPVVYGRYNQYLRLENPDGSLNRIVFLMDTNDYARDSITVNDYDSIHKDQIEWYSDTIDAVSEEHGERVKSFVFMHIPFREFADAKAALDARSTEAEYLFGKNGEKTSCPDHNSGFFDVILSKNSTEAVFVGHDHLNNMGIKYKGVDLIYSKSIDYIAYAGISNLTEQRGGTLITVLPDKYKVEQIDYGQ
ncbi:MAG: metallophosphoesterase [Oscillospiraceae bacterium]|nr:metallophosphoesterase [Oscillospiraceae bacterium]